MIVIYRAFVCGDLCLCGQRLAACYICGLLLVDAKCEQEYSFFFFFFLKLFLSFYLHNRSVSYSIFYLKCIKTDHISYFFNSSLYLIPNILHFFKCVWKIFCFPPQLTDWEPRPFICHEDEIDAAERQNRRQKIEAAVDDGLFPLQHQYTQM